MAVYVDRARLAYRRMLMSHMMADTTEELLAMADLVGVSRKWIQHPGTPREHFDICQRKRTLAIRCGAVLVSARDLALLIQRKRAGESCSHD